MQNFMFYSPTRFIFGKGEENNVGKYVAEYGATKVMVLHYGTDFDFEVSLINRVFDSLKQAGIEYVDFKDIKPNPAISRANEGAEIVKEQGIDFLLPVGGGSVIDTAKYIAVAALTDENTLGYLFPKKNTGQKSTPGWSTSNHRRYRKRRFHELRYYKRRSEKIPERR